MKILLSICATLAAVLLPDLALAWGPGVHLVVGHTILANSAMLPAATGALLLNHRDAFLYGCLSADIFIGKGKTIRPGCSHSWDTALKLLDTAPNKLAKAHALGHLTHLAADVVAHNYHVPNMLRDMPSGDKFSHVYVELLADMQVRWDPAKARSLFKQTTSADGRLIEATGGTKLGFNLKKRLVRGSLMLADNRTWNSSINAAKRLLPLPDRGAQLNEMVTLSISTAMNSLLHTHDSLVLGFDPMGRENLASVRGRGAQLFDSGTRVSQFNVPDELSSQPRFTANF